MRILTRIILLACTASLPAQISAIPVMLQPSSVIDMDAVGPAGPTTLAALIAAGTNGGAFLLSGVTLLPNTAAVGVYNTNTTLGNALAYDALNNQLQLIAPLGSFDAFDAQFDFLVPMTEFGIAIGDWVGAMDLEFRVAGSIVGTITTASYLSVGAKFFRSAVPFDQVIVRATSTLGNWVIPEVHIQNGFATVATNTSIGFGCGGLNLAANARPIIGTSWDLSLQIPATGVLGVEIFGLTDQGVNDLTAIGMPGCGLRPSLDYMRLFQVSGAAHSYSLVLPNTPQFIGLSVFTTCSVFESPASNAFGAITANAIHGMLGDV